MESEATCGVRGDVQDMESLRSVVWRKLGREDKKVQSRPSRETKFVTQVTTKHRWTQPSHDGTDPVWNRTQECRIGN